MIATIGMRLQCIYFHIRQKKSFLHNFQLALVESVDFDTQEDNLASVNQALAKKGFFILGIILISFLKQKRVKDLSVIEIKLYE